jgi:hypothetical protein
MIDATPDGEHMTDETFQAAFNKIKAWVPLVLLISGGEPTEHPKFIEYVREIKDFFALDKTIGNIADKRIVITSNGLFASDKDRFDEYMSLGVQWQVVNDPRYYPIRVEPIKDKHVMFFNEIPSLIFPAGRALANNIEAGVTNPKCFNMRNLVTTYQMPLPVAIKYMESNGKFCSPLIKPNGDIILGESVLCKPFGNVRDSDVDLHTNIINMRCNACGLFKNLPEDLRKMVGE